MAHQRKWSHLPTSAVHLLAEVLFADRFVFADAEDTFQYAMSSNGAWAGYKAYQNPQFFPKLASGQAPQIRKCLIPPLHGELGLGCGSFRLSCLLGIAFGCQESQKMTTD